VILETTPEHVWTGFTRKLASGEFGEQDCEPISGTCFGMFITEERHADWRRQICETPPPPYEFGEDKLIFFMDEGTPQEVRFDFVQRGDRWLLYFVDGVTIPIRSIDHLPFSDFPDPRTGESATHFGLMEEHISFRLKVYQRVKEKEGKTEALSWLADGLGRRVGAAAWFPYFSPRKAFIVSTAWSERRMYRQHVVIEEFGDDRCVLLFRDHVWFKMYAAAAQIHARFDQEEYREIFEHIWRDRANHSGWDASFSYDGAETRVIFTQARTEGIMNCP